jgi:glucosylglycerate phosphorylase
MVAAHGILFSMAGLPGIYIHSLLGSRSDHAGMAATGRNRSINRARLDAAAVRAELDDAGTLRHLVFSGIAHLLRTRAGEPALHPDASQTVHTLDPALVVVDRRTGGGRRLLAAINVTCKPRELWAADAANWSDILTGERFGRAPIAMAPYAVR